MGSETRIKQLAEENDTAIPAVKGGISPLLILFFIFGMAGLGIAVAALVVTKQETRQTDVLDGPAQVIDGPRSGIRSVNNWQADDFTLTNLNGDPVTLSDYQGRIVFLNVWRTDCPPCVREMPALADFQAAQGDDGAVVLAVNQGEVEENVRTFLSEIGVTGLSILLDEGYTLESDYPIPALPVTYMINADGYVVYTKYGELTTDAMNEYLVLLEQSALRG